MATIQQNKLVLFGAGKIGRSFIGQLFSLGGYEVVFIDINKSVIDELNHHRQYKLILKSDKVDVVNVYNVRGVYAGDSQIVVNEVATAGIVAVSVGKEGLKHLFSQLSKGLLERYKIDKNHPLDIIIAENMRNADYFFHQQLKKLLPWEYPMDKLVGLIETSIGKMVPLMQRKDVLEDILQVFSEPYNTLILNKKGFKNPIPDIEGLAPKENMKAWVDWKLFIHNLGHSTAAYVGYIHRSELVYLYEVLAIPEIKSLVRETMLQAANILLKKYPNEFTLHDLKEHVDDLITRFQNKALGDTIYRVGCDLTRKLGPQDRLAGAIEEALEMNVPHDKILYALVCGCHFRAIDEDGNRYKGDIEFDELFKKGIRSVLTHLSGFDETLNGELIAEAEAMDRKVRNLVSEG